MGGFSFPISWSVALQELLHLHHRPIHLSISVCFSIVHPVLCQARHDQQHPPRKQAIDSTLIHIHLQGQNLLNDILVAMIVNIEAGIRSYHGIFISVRQLEWYFSTRDGLVKSSVDRHSYCQLSKDDGACRTTQPNKSQVDSSRVGKASKVPGDP